MMKTVVATAVLGLMTSAAYAGTGHSNKIHNPYSPAYGHTYRHGAVPTRETWGQMRRFEDTHASATTAATGTKTLSYGGGVDGIGVTSGTPKVYLVVYGSQWGSAGTDANGNMTLSGDSLGAVPYLESMFKGLGTGGELWSGVMTQYCDGSAVSSGATSCPSNANYIGYPTGGAFAGIWYDNSVSSPSNATAAQLAQEAIKAAAHFGNTTAASNRYVQYVILSPTGTHPDGFNTSGSGFCAWHDWNGDAGVSSSYGDIAFTNMPYVADMGTSCGQGFVNGSSAGKLDGFSIVEGHEYAETVTDQNPAGGWTNHTGSSSNGQENGDECAWISSGQGASANVSMGNGSYAMQSTWSNDTNECDISHPIVTGSGSGGGGGGGGSGQLLSNTGFESGSAAPWSLSSGVLCSNSTCSGQSAHNGSWFAWLDGYGSSHTDTASQSVSIPSGNTSATLAFYLHIDTAETTSSTAYDTLKVQVLNSSGSVLATLHTYSNLNAASGYVQHSFDLSSYIGQTVTIKFTGTEDSSNQTSFVLDDITLNAQ
ncbi:hypothetical protein HF690_05435 [Oleiagrimonas citrea]|uniref:Serine protease n=2 Tax=Oleiagrimonas TaxID=1649642 RepID=A0A846ZLD1_9GAMM|nr:hypothetical protein [Oleiagrimonas citrea]NKZ38399.1 hypothetical protein [Oleiagrimonas citrea]